MARRSKRALHNRQQVDGSKRYSPLQAIEGLKGERVPKFDQSVDVAIRLGVDAKKSDQMVRGVAKLPHGTGRQVRVLVFAKGDKEAEARAAGADFVGGDDLVAKIQEGWMDFDRAIATPDMMAKVGRIAKILGPRGLLPNPRVGTVTADVGRAVRDEKAGRVEFRIDKAAILHVPVGRHSFAAEAILGNLKVLIEQVMRAKPATAKGDLIKGLSLSSTMGPGWPLNVSEALGLVDKEA